MGRSPRARPAADRRVCRASRRAARPSAFPPRRSRPSRGASRVKVAVVISGDAPPRTSARYTPPAVARNEASTKTSSLNRRGCRPITSTGARSRGSPARRAPASSSTAQRAIRKTTDGVAERQPVEVLRVDDSDEHIRDLRRSRAPSPPPRRSSPFGFFCTSTVPACAKASVTIANAMPLTRRLTAPRRSGTRSPTTATRSSVGASPHSHFVSAIVVRYAPIAKYRACPNERRPVKPKRRS